MAQILLIDDSWLSRKGLAGMLKPVGHEVLQADGGKAGLKMIQENSIDCVFLDLLMPEMEGYGVLESLKAQGADIPVFIITADIQDTVRVKCLDLGAAGLLNKPPLKEEILRIVETLPSTQ